MVAKTMCFPRSFPNTEISGTITSTNSNISMIPITPASPVSLVIFACILVVIVAAFLGAVYFAYHDKRKVLFAAGLTALWLGSICLAVGSGILATLPYHGLPVFFAAILIVSVLTAFSPVGRKIATAVPLPTLVAFQSFRLPLELVLHDWAGTGTIPETMTWTGQNWDILTGIVCLASAPFVGCSRTLAWVANLIGCVLLLNVVRVVVLSSPLPWAWGQQPPLALALHLPYAMIAPVCVGGALIGHIILTMALLRRPATHR